MDRNFFFQISFYTLLSFSMLFGLDIPEKMKEEYLKKHLKDGSIDANILKDLQKQSNPDNLENVNPPVEVNKIIIPKSKNSIVPDKYFGYSYFLKRSSISLYDNIPFPDNYTFGPGDEIIINIWGDIQLQSSYTINRDGNVYIDKLGQLSIVGKTLSKAESYLKKRFEVVFSTMGGDTPSTFFDLSVGKLKSININVIGEAIDPGIHSLHPFSTISTALIQAGGIESTGTLRDIQLIRSGKSIATLDFYDFLIYGKTINNIHLQDGDIIFIPLRYSSIQISGQVYRNAIFELRENEDWGDLLGFCGGIKIDAQNQIQINRILNVNNRSHEDFAKETTFISSNDVKFKLMDGDQIIVNQIHDVKQYITITGKVKNPGAYPFVPGTTILDIIETAGGINDESYRNSMDLNNIEIVRPNQYNENPDHFIINVNSIINGDLTNNIILKNWDLINVRRNKNYDTPKTVSINGEIKNPGEFAMLYRVETVHDLIKRAGGFTEKANVNGIKIIRDNKQIILKNYNFYLSENDKIIVPKHTGVVQVSGAVYNPGFVQWEKGKKLKDYIKSAGGANFNSDTDRLMVIYANGNVKIKSFFRTPKIEEGCHIIIPLEENKEDFDLTEFLTEVSSILASLATIVFVITSSS